MQPRNANRRPIDEYAIIQFDNEKIENSHYRCIAYHRKNILGQGTYGTVYLAHPVDPNTKTIDFSIKLAMKSFRTNSPANEREAVFFNRYYGKCELLRKSDDEYMVMEYIRGKSILKDKDNSLGLNDQLATLDFAKRVNIISNIMMTVFLIHNDTPKTGKALIHGDLSGSNIIVDLKSRPGTVDVYILDFGLAKELDVDLQELQPTEMIGTPLFMAKELADDNSMHGIKTDIFSLTPIFASLLGAVNPFSKRSELKWYEPGYFSTPYDLTGLCENVMMPRYHYKIADIIYKFLMRMQSFDAALRPDSEVTLKFFVKLDLFCKARAESKNHADLPLLVAFMANLAEGKAIEPLEVNEPPLLDELITEAIASYTTKPVNLKSSTGLGKYSDVLARKFSNTDKFVEKKGKLKIKKSSNHASRLKMFKPAESAPSKSLMRFIKK